MGSSDIVYTIHKRISIYLKERHIKLININKLGLKFPSHLAPIYIKSMKEYLQRKSESEREKKRAGKERKSIMKKKYE